MEYQVGIMNDRRASKRMIKKMLAETQPDRIKLIHPSPPVYLVVPDAPGNQWIDSRSNQRPTSGTIQV